MSTEGTTDVTTEDPQEALIKEEYRVWKKNSPFLYDVVMTHALEWPSLTVEWLPDKVVAPGADHSSQRLILGTHTSDGEPNYLMIAGVRLPLEDTEIDARTFAQDDEEGNKENEDKVNEEGSYGGASGKVTILQKIRHEGEVNRSRHMPQNPNLIASRSSSSEVYVFDKTRHASTEAPDSPAAPDVTLKGHSKEGYGLEWNPHTGKQGHLLSGAEDQVICLWDIGAATKSTTALDPLATFKGKHTSVIGDVCWNPHNENLFGSCGDDKTVCIWDTRPSSDKGCVIRDAHQREINSLAFNPFDEHLLATASADTTVGIWDLRNLKKPLFSLDTHTEQVMGIWWAPFNKNILASAGADRRVNVWDLSRIGQEQDPEDAEDGPPELLFIHGGHMDRLAECSWNPNDDWVMASVADDNVLQIWQMAENIYYDGGEEEEEGEDEVDHSQDQGSAEDTQAKEGVETSTQSDSLS